MSLVKDRDINVRFSAEAETLRRGASEPVPPCQQTLLRPPQSTRRESPMSGFLTAARAP